MKKVVLLIISILFIGAISLQAQQWKNSRNEFLLGLGPSNYFGDIGSVSSDENWYGLKDVRILWTRPAIYLGYKYKITSRFSGRINLNITVLGANDAGSGNSRDVVSEDIFPDLSFNSTIIGTDLLFEYAIKREKLVTSRWKIMNLRSGIKQVSKLMSAYVFGGPGYNYVKVFGNEGLKVQPEFKSSNLLLTFCGGLGGRFGLSNNLYVGFEAGAKMEPTGHLDGYEADVSGNKTSFDMFYFSNFYIVYKIVRKPRF